MIWGGDVQLEYVQHTPTPLCLGQCYRGGYVLQTQRRFMIWLRRVEHAMDHYVKHCHDK